MRASQDFFAWHDELHAFHMQVSRLFAHASMLVSYATCDLYVLTRISMRVRLPVYTNLLASCITQYFSYSHAFHYYVSTMVATLSATLSAHGATTSDRYIHNHMILSNMHCL